MAKLLSIVIPTFNRIDSLQQTLKSLSFLSEKDEVEILVIDNHSDDGTWQWLSSEHEKTGITIKRNSFNLGIEGNIIQSLSTAQGEYIWLLSDHMIVREYEIINFINQIQGALQFTLGYARIGAYEKVLSNSYVPTKLKDIDPVSLGKIMFFMGNISAFVINKKYLENCARFLFRFSGYSYPQLGVFVNLKETDTIVELGIVSDFLIQTNKKVQTKSYNSFRSRFISFVLALEKIKELNPKVNWSKQSLKNRLLLGPLAFDSIFYLCTGKLITYRDFLFCLINYPGYIKIFFLMCSLLSILPPALQVRISSFIFSTFLKEMYSKVKNSLDDSQISKIQILE